MVAATDACKAPTPAPTEEKAQDPQVLVVRGWGHDRPGIAEAFMKTVVSHSCKVLDMSQFLIEGSLMFTFVLHVGEGGSVPLMRDLTKQAKDCKLQVELHFPDGNKVEQADTSENVALISVVSTSAITPALLHDLDAVLSKHSCIVLDVDHRGDNKKDFNGDYNKVQIRVGCPRGVKLSTLCMGAASLGGSDSGLQKAAWEHGAEVTIRWWDAMNRLNGKSLVVFGLSHVLCPYDVLDEVLREVGLDSEQVKSVEGSVSKQNKSKVAMLKGHSAEAIQKVIDRLEFTPGARLVCGALKRMGFRLAVLTNTGVREIAEHVKRQLGIDYAICRDLEVVDGKFTGEYIDEVADVNFRKSDLLMLMAEREGIRNNNVIVVGEFLKGLKASNARLVLEEFGPNVFFNSTKLPDLSIALYLLGFNGSDVQSLRKRKWEEGPGNEATTSQAAAAEAPAAKKRFVVQVSSKTREAGQMHRILAPLCPLRSDVHISTVRQCSLQDGGMCLGVDFQVERKDPEQIAKDLLFACQKQGFHVLEVGEHRSVVESTSEWWQNYGVGRHIITIVQQPHIEGASLTALLSLLSKKSINVLRIERLSGQELAAMQFTVHLPEGLEASSITSDLTEVSKLHGADIAFQRDDLERSMRRMVVFDMDSTLIQQEVIDELGKIAGVEHEIKAITESAMRGEIDFFDSLKQRVALLKGHNADELFAKVIANLVYTPGAEKLCRTLKLLGFKMAVISGGFLPVAQEVQRHLGLDYAFANSLEVEEGTGLLTGCTSGPVVTPQRKRALLATIANVEGCEVQQTIAVGDGANDIPMLNTAGLGIAFCAKPKVQAVTEVRINQKDLSTVLFLIGVSERAAQRLSPEVWS